MELVKVVDKSKIEMRRRYYLCYDKQNRPFTALAEILWESVSFFNPATTTMEEFEDLKSVFELPKDNL